MHAPSGAAMDNLSCSVGAQYPHFSPLLAACAVATPPLHPPLPLERGSARLPRVHGLYHCLACHRARWRRGGKPPCGAWCWPWLWRPPSSCWGGGRGGSSAGGDAATRSPPLAPATRPTPCPAPPTQAAGQSARDIHAGAAVGRAHRGAVTACCRLWPTLAQLSPPPLPPPPAAQPTSTPARRHGAALCRRRRR